MSAARLSWCGALVVMACAAWEGPPPMESPPPAGDGATPSHHTPEYAPPPPGDPRETPPKEAPKETVTVAIASVQLIQDCPDPEPRVEMNQRAPTASEKAEMAAGAGRRKGPGGAFRQPCTQSTVQLAIDIAGVSGEVGPARAFRVEAVRLLDAASQKVAGTAKLRGPTEWTAGTYAPWDERLRSEGEQKVSYKLGEPDVSKAAETVGPGFNAHLGPFILELEVSIDGARRTIRSSEFSREKPHVIVT